MDESLNAHEVRYPWLPSHTRVIDLEHYVVVNYKGKEFTYSTNVTEEILKKDILEGGLEKKLESGA